MEQCFLELASLNHLHEDAVDDEFTTHVSPRGVAEHAYVFVIQRAKEEKNFLGASVHPDERIEMRLIKNPAPRSEERLKMSSSKELSRVTQPTEECCVGIVNPAVVTEGNKAAGGILQNIRERALHEVGRYTVAVVPRYSLISATVSSGWLMCGQ